MKTKITADSTCDLSPELVEKYNITILPLNVTLGGVVYSDGVDLEPIDIFNHVSNGGEISKTSAVNQYTYEQFFEKILAEGYDAIVHINISHEFSSCYQNACLAAKKFEHVYIVDSMNLSTGSGHIVLDGAIMAQNGVDPAEIKRVLDETTPLVEASFVIDTLDYLKMGGRCSSVAALGAKALSLKPNINVVDGRMIVGKKYIGKYASCVKKYVTDKLKDRDDIDYSRIFITHTCLEGSNIPELVKQTVNELAQFDEVLETHAGCTVATHCGPECIGILFKRKKQ